MPTSTAALTRLPVTMIRTWLTVEAVVDGRECRFVVDTGSPATVLSARTAADLGIAGDAAATIATYDGTVATMRRAEVESIGLGDRVLTGWRVLIADDTVLDCFGIDGIIGGDILRRYVVRFSMRDGYVILADRLSEIGAVDRRHSARMRLVNNKSYCARCYLCGAKGKYPVRLLFDTGAVELSLGEWERLHGKGVLTDLHMSDGYGVSSGLAGGGVVADAVQMLAVVPQLRFAGVDMHNVPVQSGRKSLIGLSLLQCGDVVADYPGRRIYYVADEVPVSVGDGVVQVVNIRPAFDAVRGVVVGSVWDPALVGRVSAGDRIVRIDDMPTEAMSVCDFYRHTYKAGQTRFTIETADGESEYIMMNITE